MLRHTDLDEQTERIGEAIVDAAIKVHKVFGPGLLEAIYEASLARELVLRGLRVARQVQVPVSYEGADLGLGFRLDLKVEDCAVVEVKAVEALLPVHDAQVLTYLKLTDLRLGFLLNFNVPAMKAGIKRLVR
jgi:GxxExxY protein